MLTKIHSRMVLAKRQKVALSAILAGVLFLGMRFLAWPLEAWVGWLMVVLMSVFWVLDWDLRREEWCILPLPIMSWSAAIATWTLVVGTTRFEEVVGISIVYAVGLYALLLATNILNLSIIKTVPLAKTALTVWHAFALLSLFMLLYVLRILQLGMLAWCTGVVVMTFLSALPLIWVSLSSARRLGHSVGWASGLAYLILQVAIFTAFWPSSFMTGLFLASMTLLAVGVLHYQERRIFTAAIGRQYMLLASVVFVLYFLLTSWGK
jgi:hypothetical protein